MLDAVIFDMDGTMFDTEPVWERTWDPIMEKYGLPMTKDLYLACVGTSLEGAIEVVRQRFGDGVDARAINEEHWALAGETLMSECIPEKPGLSELLAHLSEQGVPMAVASSSSRELVESHLRAHGIMELFGAIVAGDEVDRSKPDPQIFLIAAEKLGADPTNSLVIEDSYNGIRAAAAGGFHRVMVPDVIAPDDEISALAGHVCKDLHEVRELIAAGEV